MAVHRLSGKHYTLKDIERGIRHKEHLYRKAVKGDSSAIDLIADAEQCIKLSDPTYIQAQAVHLVWKQNYTLQDAGDILDVSPQAVRFNLQLLSVKMKEILDEWAHQEEMHEVKKEIREERAKRKGKRKTTGGIYNG